MLTKTNKQNISFFILANLKKLLTDFINFSTTDTTSNKLKACSSSCFLLHCPERLSKACETDKNGRQETCTSSQNEQI